MNPISSHRPLSPLVFMAFATAVYALPNGLPVVYLDSGASAQKPQCVIDKQTEVQENYFANAYRGRHSFGSRIDEELESVREKARQFISAESTDEIVFTSGTTFSVNLVAQAWGRKFLHAGDELLLNEMGDINTGTPLDWLPLSGLGGN